jgi:hypothetical protein
VAPAGGLNGHGHGRTDDVVKAVPADGAIDPQRERGDSARTDVRHDPAADSVSVVSGAR